MRKIKKLNKSCFFIKGKKLINKNDEKLEEINIPKVINYHEITLNKVFIIRKITDMVYMSLVGKYSELVLLVNDSLININNAKECEKKYEISKYLINGINEIKIYVKGYENKIIIESIDLIFVDKESFSLKNIYENYVFVPKKRNGYMFEMFSSYLEEYGEEEVQQMNAYFQNTVHNNLTDFNEK